MKKEEGRSTRKSKLLGTGYIKSSNADDPFENVAGIPSRPHYARWPFDHHHGPTENMGGPTVTILF